jgi:hypothetical protein
MSILRSLYLRSWTCKTIARLSAGQFENVRVTDSRGMVHILAGKGEIAKKKFYPDKTPDISLI